MTNQVQYTFTFKKEYERRFRDIMSRLADDEYTILEPIADFNDETQPYEKFMRTVMTMEPEAATTFRFGMKELNIRRLRTEEEEEAERKLIEENTVRIRVQVPGNPSSNNVPGV